MTVTMKITIFFKVTACGLVLCTKISDKILLPCCRQQILMICQYMSPSQCVTNHKVFVTFCMTRFGFRYTQVWESTLQMTVKGKKHM